MITEDYVSFETAKLLKEKGFEPPHDYRKCLPIMYTDNGEIKWGVWSDDWYPRITLQMAMKWLREVHNIAINIGWGSVFEEYYRWWCVILDQKSGKILQDSEYYKTYEEACEAAIKYCLENLIQ